MQSPALKVKEALYTALNGNVSYENKPIPVYSVVPDNVADKYIYLKEVVANNQDAKDRFISEGYFQIQVFTAFNTNAGSQAAALSISNTIINILQPQIGATLDLGANFNNVYLYRENSTGFSEDDLTRKIERRVLRFRFLIEELT